MRKVVAALFIISAIVMLSCRLEGSDVARASSAPSVFDTRPESNLLVGSEHPQIWAQYGGGSSAVDPTSVRLTVDNVDVTNVTTVTSSYVSYVALSSMSAGLHTASVQGRAQDGSPFSTSWTFRVAPSMVASDLNPFFNYPPGPFGYPGYGFYPPGFSLFTPGPIYFIAGDFIEIVFFSPFFPYGDGFVTIYGIPGRFFFTPWAGCPGYFWVNVPVPFGVRVRDAVLSAHFTTESGQTVIVHSTAPLQIDGTRHTLPASFRYANEPVFNPHPLTPQQYVHFVRVAPNMAVLPHQGLQPVEMRHPLQGLSVPDAAPTKALVAPTHVNAHTYGGTSGFITNSGNALPVSHGNTITLPVSRGNTDIYAPAQINRYAYPQPYMSNDGWNSYRNWQLPMMPHPMMPAPVMSQPIMPMPVMPRVPVMPPPGNGGH